MKYTPNYEAIIISIYRWNFALVRKMTVRALPFSSSVPKNLIILILDADEMSWEPKVYQIILLPPPQSSKEILVLTLNQRVHLLLLPCQRELLVPPKRELLLLHPCQWELLLLNPCQLELLLLYPCQWELLLLRPCQ